MHDADHLARPALEFARHDLPLLGDHLDVAGALEELRRHEVGERVVYLYVVDRDRRLVGVLPVRRLLHAREDERLSDLALRRVVSLPASATVMEACELLLTHRFLALPIVDDDGRLLGIVDVALLTDEVFDLAERQAVDSVFETVGLRIAQAREASPLRGFRFRMPWLLATIAGGTGCALLAGLFEATLADSLVLAFFLTLVLGLSESVAVQSVTLTVQALHAVGPSLAWYRRVLWRELRTALMLGAACGTLVALTVFLWRGDVTAALSIGLSIAMAQSVAAAMGTSVPTVLHALELDPKVAAGPVALALTDLATVVLYLGAATVLLRR